MTVLYHLLRDGYFPKELPPAFNTTGFSQLMASSKAALPTDFKYNKKNTVVAKLSEHNIARVGTIRRKLSIPNPITHFILCDIIGRNWQAIRNQFLISPLSKSKPIPATNPIRAFSPNNSPNKIPQLRARYRLGSRYLLKTDIKDFYHSIYTHENSEKPI